mgnify:CR=1 FL=1
MNPKPIYKSKRSKSNTIIVVLGIFMLLFFIFLFNNNFQPKVIYEQHIKIFVILIIIIGILYCIFYLLNTKRVYVYPKYFEVKNLFSTKRYYYTDIKTYFSDYIKAKYNSWTEYYLFLNTGEKITFLDSEFSNFHVFFGYIERKIKKDNEVDIIFKKKSFLNYAIISAVISVFLLYGSSFFYDFKEITHDDFVDFSGILKDDIKLVTGSKGKKHLEFHLINQPIYDFKILGPEYDEIDDKIFLNKFKAGDTIIITIEKEEYDKKIVKTKNLNFKDKYISYTSIRVRQIKTLRDRDYIDLEKLNKQNRESNYLGIGMFSFFALLFLYFAFGNYKAYQNPEKYLD